jgi:hypothetical protein
LSRFLRVTLTVCGRKQSEATKKQTVKTLHNLICINTEAPRIQLGNPFFVSGLRRCGSQTRLAGLLSSLLPAFIFTATTTILKAFFFSSLCRRVILAKGDQVLFLFFFRYMFEFVCCTNASLKTALV